MATAAAAADEPRQLAALREAFGDSSDSDSDAPHVAAIPTVISGAGHERWRWEAVAGVRGLWLCAAFLSANEQSRLLAAIQREGWFSDAHNQAMRFGDLPSWAVELSALIRETICAGDIDVDAGWNRLRRMKMHALYRQICCGGNHFLINSLQIDTSQGICAHVDLMRFDDGIAIVSLDSACVMHFSREEPGAASDSLKDSESESTNVAVYLNPGSLLVMSGDARYHWKHEINRKPGAQLWDGKELEQHRRTSVTLRKLRASPN